jgi:lysyl-tRNA synthetase class 1
MTIQQGAVAGSENERKLRHWSETIVERLTQEKKEVYVITGGMTTSGPAHLGTVCEFLYPSVIDHVLRSKGYRSEFHFIGDILDAFDGIPAELQKYSEELIPELGKPLVHTKDPMGCHKSLGEHYLSQAQELMKLLGLSIDVIKVNEVYDKGMFDPYARLFLKEIERVKEIVAKSSGRKIEEFKDWSPLMPICEKCGKVATTSVTRHEGDEYEYACNKDVKYVKGCDFKGKNRLSDHKYKLQWRLDWPARQAIFNTSTEGSGVDHMTKGGSWDTAYAIHKEILKREPPMPYKYGFVLFQGKKYSKSKGIGMSALDIIKLIPPEMLKYILIEPNLEMDKDIDPSGEKLISLYNDLERVDRMARPETRADEKKLLALRLSTPKLRWKSSFVEMLLDYQIYKDWKTVEEKLDDKEGVEYLMPYISEWLQRGFEPEKYNFSIKPTKIKENEDAVKAFSAKLDDGMSDLDIHNLVYSIAGEKKLKADLLFKTLYIAIIGKENGPRLGKLIASLGPARTKEILELAVS